MMDIPLGTRTTELIEEIVGLVAPVETLRRVIMALVTSASEDGFQAGVLATTAPAGSGWKPSQRETW
jgi:hypothetical protein